MAVLRVHQRPELMLPNGQPHADGMHNALSDATHIRNKPSCACADHALPVGCVYGTRARLSIPVDASMISVSRAKPAVDRSSAMSS